MESQLKLWRNLMFVVVFAAILAAAATCIADSPFGTEVVVTQTTALTAKSARVEQLPDKVAIFVDGEEPVRQLGLRIGVTSTAKWVAVRATIVGQGRPISVSKLQSGDYLLFGSPAIYSITVIESDPERGLNFTDIEATIVGSPPVKPVEPDPVDPPPPSNGELQKLAKIASEVAAKINDPKTALALSVGYKRGAVEIDSVTSVEAAKTVISNIRKQVLNARTGESLTKDWNAWLVAIEPEVTKHLGSVAEYKSAVLTVANSLAK